MRLTPDGWRDLDLDRLAPAPYTAGDPHPIWNVCNRALPLAGERLIRSSGSVSGAWLSRSPQLSSSGFVCY